MIKEEIRKEILKLPEKERAELAHLLIESLQPQKTYKSEEDWAEELKRRVERFETGEGELTPWEEVSRKARSIIEE